MTIAAAMIEASPIAAVISNPRLADNPIIACNRAFEELTGYGRDEIVGRNCRFLSGPGTEPGLSEEIREAVRERRPVLVEILNYKKDGTPFRNAVLVAPIFDEDGALEFFLGSQVEVPDATLHSGSADSTGEDPVNRRKQARAMVDALPRRQQQVLAGMAAGKLNKQIAYELGITQSTVKMHRAAVMTTLGVKAGADAIRIAVEAGL